MIKIALFGVFLLNAIRCTDDQAILASEEKDRNFESTSNEEIDSLIDRTNLEDIFSAPGSMHLPATEQLQRLVDSIENISIDEYTDNFEPEHLDFINFDDDI